jgi:hypothetical protein
MGEQCIPKAMPLLGCEAEAIEERRLSAVVGMQRVEKIVADFGIQHHRRFGVRQ